MKKVISVLLCLSAAFVYAQVIPTQIPENFFEEQTAEKSRFSFSYFFTAGAAVIQNTAPKTASAPSPVLFSPGFGVKLPAEGLVSFEPHLSFFMNYYLWNSEIAGGSALPAEMENRTALVPSLLLDLPAVFSFSMHRHTFFAGAGIAFLFRYGFLAGNVDPGDYGDAAHPDSVQITAADAVNKINSWFWSDLRFLYPELLFGWNMMLPNKWKAGAELRLYIPLGSIAAGSIAETGIFDTAIISCTVRLTLP